MARRNYGRRAYSKLRSYGRRAYGSIRRPRKRKKKDTGLFGLGFLGL